MKASDLLVRSLENEGVEYIFGIPGEENLDFLDSLKDSSIKLILTRHEQAAGFMAATYGRLTGKPGVCMSTLGPGATNLFTAAAYAQLGGMPMVMITGQKPIHESKQGRFQIIDVVEMMKPVTKFTRQITSGNKIPSLVREAFRISEEERPGAVHLELPEDVARERTLNTPFEPSDIRLPDADPKSVDMALRMIQKAKAPLILVGAGANRSDVSDRLTKFLEKSGILFFNTQMGKGVVCESHKQFLGTAALSDNDYLHCAIDRADVIVNIGHDIIEKPPFLMKKGGTKVIHVNFFSAHIDEVYFPQIEVIGDIANTLRQLTERIVSQSHWDFSYYNTLKKFLEKNISSSKKDVHFPIRPQRLVADVREVMGNEDIVTLDNGVYKIWFARNYLACSSNTLLLDNALATMGAGLPSAMAAKMVYPHKKVVAVVGDGGFMMNSQELETAVRLGLDLTVIILNDSAYGMIQWKQQAVGMEVFGLDFKNPDFVKYAESYGAKGYRVKKVEDLKDILQKTTTSKGVHVIDVPVDYSENEKFTKELRKKTCQL